MKMKYSLTVWMIEHTSRSISNPSGNMQLFTADRRGAFPSLLLYHLSQWGKQFNLCLLLSFHLCPSACIIVTTAFFNCYNETFYRMNADNCGMAAKHLAFVTLCWMTNNNETHQGERGKGKEKILCLQWAILNPYNYFILSRYQSAQTITVRLYNWETAFQFLLIMFQK